MYIFIKDTAQKYGMSLGTTFKSLKKISRLQSSYVDTFTMNGKTVIGEIPLEKYYLYNYDKSGSLKSKPTLGELKLCDCNWQNNAQHGLAKLGQEVIIFGISNKTKYQSRAITDALKEAAAFTFIIAVLIIKAFFNFYWSKIYYILQQRESQFLTNLFAHLPILPLPRRGTEGEVFFFGLRSLPWTAPMVTKSEPLRGF